jgi:hypothetical protein
VCNRGPPDTYRIALSTFQPADQRLHLVVGDLIPTGFLAKQLCVVGKSSVIAPLASLTDANSAIHAALSQLVTNVERIPPLVSGWGSRLV